MFEATDVSSTTTHISTDASKTTTLEVVFERYTSYKATFPAAEDQDKPLSEELDNSTGEYLEEEFASNYSGLRTIP